MDNNQLALWSEAPVQATFDWDTTFAETKELVKEDAELTSTIDEAMVKRFQGRVKIGFNLMALQSKHSKHRYGNFTTQVLPELGIDARFSQRCISVARLYQNSIATRVSRLEDVDIALPMNTWNEVSASPVGETVIEQVMTGEIRANPKAIKEANEKAKKAEEDKQRIEQELRLFKWEKQLQDSERDAKLKKLEDDLKATNEEKEKIAQSKKEIIQEDTPETKSKLEQLDRDIKALEAKEKTLKADKKTLSDEATKLSAELKKLQDDNKDKLRQERYEQKVKEQCKKSNETIQKALTQYVGQLPTALASQVYTFDEWAQLDQTDKLLDYCKEAIAHAKQEARNSQLIDANPSNGLVVYDSQEPHVIEVEQSIPPAIEHFATDIDCQALFAEYQQYVKTFPDEKLWWRAPQCGIKDMEMDRDLHIHYTRELLKSGDPYRITAAIEGMKRTLGYGATVG